MSTKIKLDLNTKYIPTDHQIWIIHPGRRRRFYSTFKDEGVVFLEYPGLNISAEALKHAAQIKQHLKMSYAIKKYLLHKDYEDISIPPKNPASYTIDSKDDFGGDVGNINNLFFRAKVGDLVIVPGWGQYEPILFGEIKAPFNPNNTIIVKPFGNEQLQYRAVKWFHRDIPKRKLPQVLAKRLENPHAIIQIDLDNTTRKFYDFAYDSYVFGESSKTELRGNQGHNLLPLNDANSLITYFIAAYFAINQGKANQLANLSIEETIAQFYDEKQILELGLEFHSPGKFTLAATATAICSLVAIGIILSMDDKPFEQLQGNVEVVNSKESSNSAITQKIDSDTQQLLNALGANKLAKSQLKKHGNNTKAISLQSNVVKK